MKKLTLFISLCSLLTTANAQYGICLEYDNAGNRTFRHDCVSMLVGGEEQNSFKSAAPINSLVKGEVLAFPNPTDGVFELRTGSGFPSETQVTVLDELGRTLENRTLGNGHFDLSNQVAGTYYLKIKHGEVQQMVVIIKSDR